MINTKSPKKLKYMETLTYLHCINQPNVKTEITWQGLISQISSGPHQVASMADLLTSEGESRREDQKHAAAVHGECDGKVDRNTSPHK